MEHWILRSLTYLKEKNLILQCTVLKEAGEGKDLQKSQYGL